MLLWPKDGGSLSKETGGEGEVGSAANLYVCAGEGGRAFFFFLFFFPPHTEKRKGGKESPTGWREDGRQNLVPEAESDFVPELYSRVYFWYVQTLHIVPK